MGFNSAFEGLIRPYSILWRSYLLLSCSKKKFKFSGNQIFILYSQNLTVSHINPVRSFLIHFNTKHLYVKRPYFFTLCRQHFEYIYILLMRKYKTSCKKFTVSWLILTLNIRMSNRHISSHFTVNILNTFILCLFINIKHRARRGLS